MRALLVFLSFVALVFCVPPTQDFKSITNYAGNNIIYTQTEDFFSLPNILNPVAVSIIFNNGTDAYTANVCLNANQAANPTPGNNFNACPSGGFVSGLQNTTAATTGGSSKLKFNRQSSSLKLGQFLSKMVEDTNPNALSAYTSSTFDADTAGFTVVINGASSLVSFTATVTYSYCEDGTFPTPDGSDCVDAISLNQYINNTYAATIPANSTAYYSFTTADFDSTIDNQFILTYNVTSTPVLVQKGYIPSAEYNIPQATAGTVTIDTPGYFSVGDTYYFSIQNTDTTNDLILGLTLNYTTCGAGLVGPGCAVNQTATNTTDGSTIIALSGVLTAEGGGSLNDGNAWQIDLSGSANQYAYFYINPLPDLDFSPYYVRVSVGNIDLEDDDSNIAPTLWAKKGGIPSSQSYDLTVSGGVANQAFLQVDDYATDEWYVAVQLPSNFAIWVGVNCAGNCSNNEHGSCVCSYANGTVANCQDLANSTNLDPLYSLPSSTQVSAGSCSCSDEDYDLSYDCSQKSSPTVLFIVLIVIGGLIILFVAIGVPLYCYWTNKRRERFERI